MDTRDSNQNSNQHHEPDTKVGLTVADNETSLTLPLSESEQQTLKQQEVTIKNGIATFMEVGLAFAHIRDNNLYREHGTFDDYCQKVWNISRSKAYRYMAAAKCVKHLKCCQMATKHPMVIPATEAQARKIARKTPDEQELISKNVAKNTANPTTRDIEVEVERLDNENKPRVMTHDVDAVVDVENITTSDIPCEALSRINDKLTPMKKIQDRIKQIYYIYCNSSKKEEGLKLFGELQRWVESWVKWEAEQRAEEAKNN